MKEQALKERLKVIAKEKNTVFQAVWNQLLLERFLVRLAQSEFSEQFIFKGGLLLSKYLEIGRETRDLDFLIEKLDATSEHLSQAISEICRVENFDGFSFTLESLEQLLHPHMQYLGFRAKLRATLENMRDIVQLDVGVGDVVNPVDYDMTLFTYRDKPLFEGHVSLQVYPVETIFAEKLETVVARGNLNSRMKDFHDLLLLARDSLLLSPKKCKDTITTTFAHRKTEMKLPIRYDDEVVNGMQKLWSRHLSGLGKYQQELKLPASFSEVVEEINAFLANLSFK
jgi:predicted nucleotidyltransferase component of viral defense system